MTNLNEKIDMMDTSSRKMEMELGRAEEDVQAGKDKIKDKDIDLCELHNKLTKVQKDLK